MENVKMNIVEKLTANSGNSSVRLVQLTREYIQTSDNPLKTANALIEELGGRAIPKKYEARIVAQNMMVARAVEGSAFDHDTAFEKAKLVAEKMTKELRAFSEHENKVEEPAITKKQEAALFAKPVVVKKQKVVVAKPKPVVEKKKRNSKYPGGAENYALSFLNKFGRDDKSKPMIDVLIKAGFNNGTARNLACAYRQGKF